MNIFVLDTDPVTCAQYHCDKHVIKMILESVQMLSTTCSILGAEVPYKPTHANHPCTKWVRESHENFIWLHDLAYALEDEWRFRYNHPHDKRHASIVLLEEYNLLSVGTTELPFGERTSFAQAMPEQYKSCNPVQAYRAYYAKEKTNLLTFTKRGEPEWLKEYIMRK